MKIKRTQAISAVAVVLLLILGYVFLSRKASGETVIVGKDGLVRKEKYISLDSDCYNKNAPTWCGDEFVVAYSNTARDDTDNSWFNGQTGMCSDGTRDCLYFEKYNSDRILQGIFNSKGEELGQKFLDDLYSGKIKFSDSTYATIKSQVTFEDGVMKFIDDRGKKYEVKVGVRTSQEMYQASQQGIQYVTPSMFLLYLAVYFKANNLPKPTLNYQLHSSMNATQYRASLPEEETREVVAPTPTPTPEPMPMPETTQG